MIEATEMTIALRYFFYRGPAVALLDRGESTCLLEALGLSNQAVLKTISARGNDWLGYSSADCNYLVDMVGNHQSGLAKPFAAVCMPDNRGSTLAVSQVNLNVGVTTSGFPSVLSV